MTRKTPGINRLIDLQKLLLRFGSIKRFAYLPDGTKENDVEHSYSLAMSGWFLAQYFPELDRDKVIRTALAHDLVEVHAGDTFVFADEQAKAGKKDREHLALQQLKKDWPDFPELFKEIQEYEDLSTPEAKFVYALDKLMPAIINYLSAGRVWHEHNITFETFRAEKESKIPISPEINEYYHQLLVLLQKNPDLFPVVPSKQR